jgi:hypothetical protein
MKQSFSIPSKIQDTRLRLHRLNQSSRLAVQQTGQVSERRGTAFWFTIFCLNATSPNNRKKKYVVLWGQLVQAKHFSVRFPHKPPNQSPVWTVCRQASTLMMTLTLLLLLLLLLIMVMMRPPPPCLPPVCDWRLLRSQDVAMPVAGCSVCVC